MEEHNFELNAVKNSSTMNPEIQYTVLILNVNNIIYSEIIFRKTF